MHFFVLLHVHVHVVMYSIFPPHPLGYLPPPIRPTQLAQRLLQQQKYQRLTEESGDVQEIEMEVEENEPEVLDIN